MPVYVHKESYENVNLTISIERELIIPSVGTRATENNIRSVRENRETHVRRHEIRHKIFIPRGTRAYFCVTAVRCTDEASRTPPIFSPFFETL